ncbi:acetolactate synthase-1/2/3 large subunit [Pullulanibacillus pueri]|uniref:Acetolactate synthase n=1 Tax=Pullulanibacillus pueri TaxID=1437324 RepID=A0A8J3EMY7_9BACL|nr:acetolactate synthase large subunit [Pullulanibacillus pueri]MBM7683569.1 acetolactate synthase-1/2/3 large subunit [Pullulanibacillus pueri]GGH84465.1 acetolactate synthase large subunit [Pullulanibacillus pueri]
MQAKAKYEQTVASQTGADVLMQTLIDEGVDLVFGYPGGAVLPIYDALYKTDLRHILPRHEQGAIHAAEGYARISGKPGVVIGTSGPGATNLITGIADAMMDSLPLVVFTGQVARGVIGTDAFQEADVTGITTPITKHNYQIQELKDIPRVVKEAFHIATTGRPGPVVVDIPKDISGEIGEVDYPETIHLPGYQPNYMPNLLQVRKLAEAMREAKRPVILAGAGIIHSGAHKALLELVERQGIPVVHTLLGLGGFPAEHELFLGMAGMHGTYAANMALYEADLLINIGARFDDRLTGDLQHFAKKAVVAHIDIDPAEIGKNVQTHIPIVADAKFTIEALLDEVTTPPEINEWVFRLKQDRIEKPLWYRKQPKVMAPQYLIEKLHQETNGEAIVVTDVGQHQMWAAQYYPFSKPKKWVTSGGLGTMGFGFPAAIGAQLAAPDDTVIAVVGDGGFQMTLQELSVLQELRLPVKIVIVNNQSLGMVRQWQTSFYGGRHSQSLIPVQPDFVKLAETYDIRGYRVETEEELQEVLSATLHDREPVLIDCRVNAEEMVTPMVAPGTGIHEMIGVKP